jgi:hypothetical protein
MTSRACFILFAFVVACGGKTSDITDGGGGNDGGPQPGPDCPTSVPAEGASCKIDALQCEYGGDPRSVCNTIAVCNKGSWTYFKGGDPSCPTPATNPPDCPATLAQVQVGAKCPSMGEACNYSTSSATQFCTCSYMGGPVDLDGGFSGTWQCGAPFETGCPTARPRIGAACSQPDLNCSYDSCGAPSGLSFQCSGQTGTWIQGFGDVCAGAN